MESTGIKFERVNDRPLPGRSGKWAEAKAALEGTITGGALKFSSGDKNLAIKLSGNQSYRQAMKDRGLRLRTRRVNGDAFAWLEKR